MPYLLDTCAWMHAVLEPEILTSEAKKILSSDEILHLSSISLLEVSLLNRLNRICVKMDFQQWLENVALPPRRFKVHPIDPPIVTQSQNLPAPFRSAKGEIHKDPFDRIITATARQYGLTLLTSDQILLDYQHVNTLKHKR